ncbi:MAG: ribosome biogenesis GTPase Der [Candidatus Babeliaceae bacterium]|jgi:GTP-binding protein
MSNIRSVVIVGRMNVGKSTLFNKLSESVRSITLDYAGVTRDFIKDVIEWKNHRFEIIDTGGISLRKTEDIILEKVRQTALDLVQKTDLVVFVVDSLVGVLPEDREIAQLLHKNNKKVILVINKIDNTLAQEHIHEFYKLGFPHTVSISAEHSKGINDVLNEIVDLLPQETSGAADKEPDYRVVFLGRPNVGKSSLMNALLQEERSIVSDIPGTTREAISEKIQFYQQNIELTDTPGIRRKRSVGGQLEPLMVKSSFAALKNADIVVLVLDVTEAKLVDQELKLAFYAFEEHYKALIIVFNKIDLKTELMDQELERSLSLYNHLIKKVPLLNISCKSGKNVGRLVPLIEEVWQRFSQKLSDEEVNRLIVSSLQKKPLYHNQKLLRVYGARQVAQSPITILIDVNEPDWFGPSQLGFFENIIRGAYTMIGVPIKFIVRKKA